MKKPLINGLNARPQIVHQIARGGSIVEALPLRIVNLARTYSIRAIETLMVIMEDPITPPAVRIKCVEVILDRGYGKAHQSLSVEDNTAAAQAGLAGIPILDRVKAIIEARTIGTTVDVVTTDVVDTPSPTEINVTPQPDDGSDLI